MLTAIFTVFSIPLIIPFFQILFDRNPLRVAKPDSLFALADWVRYYGSELIQNNDKQSALFYVCIAIVIVFFFKNLFRYLSSFVVIPIRNGVLKDLRQSLYKTYLEMPMIYISAELTVFVFVLMLFTVLIIGFVSRKLKQQSGRIQEGMGKLISHTEHSISGVGTIKTYGAEKFMGNHFEHENNSIFNTLNALLRRKDLSSPLSEFLGVSVVAVLLWYGSTLVFENNLYPETFFAFVFAFYQVIEPSKSFSTAYYNFKKGMAAMDRIDAVIMAKALQEESMETVKFPLDWKNIEFKELDFKYEDEEILKNINLKIDRGEKIAIIGASGSGKSTLIKLLLRFYKPTKGDITIGKKSLGSIQRASMEGKIALVNQDPVLFNDSIKNNILLGRAEDTLALEHVFTSLGLDALLKEKKEGENFIIGDHGKLLSGGEKQRLCIARALYGHPDIVILDEATSSLDSKSEQQVTQAIEKAIAGRTAIIIAHRLSTLKLVDKIYVLEDGQIVEKGNHETLMQSEGKYRSYFDQYMMV